jgi:hypothetical protein
MCWFMYPSRNVVLCLFYASEQAKVWKTSPNSVYHLSQPPNFFPHMSVLPASLPPPEIWVTNKETGENQHGKQNHMAFGHEGLVKTKLWIIVIKRARAKLFKSFDKFKIASLETEVKLPKLQLK